MKLCMKLSFTTPCRFNRRTEEQMEQQAYRRGLELFRKMAGSRADEIRHQWQELAPDFERYVLGFLAGEVWTRPGLDLRTRSLITVAALTATGRQQGLELNIRMALNNGVTQAEIVETLLHLAAYVGFPTAWEALTLAGCAFAESQAAAVNTASARPRRQRRREGQSRNR
jgi:alkylhydroperoxidase/carboxymuconolactone decarboxylase family protein YurZ